MTDLVLYLHPLASFCHKVLIALYENDTAFAPVLVDFADPGAAAALLDRWPVGKIPVLEDRARGVVLPETTIIIEHLARHCPGPVRLLPDDPDTALQVRLWDRFFDLYVSQPMQKIVLDRLRPEGQGDAFGVAEARAQLQIAYAMIDMQAGEWAVGDSFTMADCAAAPALFFAGIVEPFGDHPRLHGYFDRLMARPSVARTIDGARPYFRYFPYADAIPARFL